MKREAHGAAARPAPLLQWGARTHPRPATNTRGETRRGETRRGGGVVLENGRASGAARPLFPLRACPVPFGRPGKEVPSQPLQAAGAIFKCLCQAPVWGSRCRSPGAPGDAEVALRRGRTNCRLTDTRTEVEEAL